MLPLTTQATETEVEGQLTVSVDGANAQGESLQDLQQEEATENQTADSSTEEVQAEAGEPAKTESDTQPSEKTPRIERRTEKLIDNLKARTDEVSALRKQLEQMKAPTPQQSAPQLPPWMNNPLPQTEITPEEYQAQVVGTAREIVSAELSAYKANVAKYEGYHEDLLTVEDKYPILKKGSDVYDSEKARDVADLYQKASTADPSLRLATFVDKIMSFHQAGQDEGKREIKASVLKREAEAAVTPNQNTGEQGSDSDWESMSLKDKEDWMKKNGIWDQ